MRFVPENAYDIIPYPNHARIETHPDRLSAVGTLFGMNRAPVTNCRVLEIGCGDGGNLIPMAYSLPESRFIGIDLADGLITAGRESIDALDLRNISLAAGDLREIDASWGEFDYIIAHGLYSWIPAAVRDRLLAVCGERLTPNGIAFVSYNAYPGGHVRQMMREMLIYHVRGIDEPAARVEEARRFLEFFLRNRMLSPVWRGVLDQEAKSMLERGEGGLFHDDLAEINEPISFRDFVAHAGRHGLQYLGEAEPYEMFDHQGSLGDLGANILEREQYLDFLKARRFRQTLVCREGVALDHDPDASRMDRFLFSGPARKVTVSAIHEAVNSVTGALQDAYPLPLPFEELVPYVGEVETLREILLALVRGGYADIHVHDFPCEETVTERPAASRLARYQAARSRTVTNACHKGVQLDEIGRNLILLLDGTRDHQQIAQDLSAIADAPPLEEIRRHLHSSLEWMARMALLEA
jgi:methyltransferase-like protein